MQKFTTLLMTSGEKDLPKFDFELTGSQDRSLDAAVFWIILGRQPEKPKQLTELVKSGLKVKVIHRLAKQLDTSNKELMSWLRLSTSTADRWAKENKFLSTDYADKVVRYAKLLAQSEAMMQGDKDAALRWLKSPKRVLGGETPLERATTEAGADDVERLIGRIRHGVFS
ncbi:MAG: antitoxin Xre/MbcA/ParS toxin-binding domain-containing protein [Pseudomonadota bacterium]